VDHRRHARRGVDLVRRQQAVPAQPGRGHRARVQADPDRVVPSWALIQEEAMNLVNGSTAAGLTVRIVGSTGIRLHCPDASATMDAVDRPAKDIDLVVRHSDRGRRVEQRAVKLREAIDGTQKSRGWRMRARVGERMQWWDDVSDREDTY